MKEAEGREDNTKLIEFLKNINCDNWNVSDPNNPETRSIITNSERDKLITLYTSLVLDNNDQDINGIKKFLDLFKANDGIELSGNIYPDNQGNGNIGTSENSFINMYLKNTNIWLENQYKLFVENNNLRYRKVKLNVVPRSIYNAYSTQK